MGKLVDPNEWHLFANLGLQQWLIYNLQKSVTGSLRWDWSILFASFIHMLWIDRNHLVFSSKTAFPDLILPKLLGHIKAIETHLHKPSPSFLEASMEVPVRWTLPLMGVFKLNSDGSLRNGLAACGGLLHNHHGHFIKGYHYNLGVASSILVELWGLIHGLRLAKSMHMSSLVVELDSKAVVSMIRK